MLLRTLSKWVWVSLAIVLVGSVFMAACGDEPSPTPTPTSQNYIPNPNYTPAAYPTRVPSSRVAYARGVHSNCGPFYNSPDIPGIIERDYTPDILAWTQDGNRIIFDNPRVHSFGGRRDDANGWDIHSLDAGGAYLHRIVDANPEYLPHHGVYADVSPDGSRIVYASCEYPSARELYPTDDLFERERYNYEIVIRNIDGTDPRRLTENIVMDHYPVWSPDGSRIAFARTARGRGIPDGVPVGIVVAAADGSDQRTITDQWASSISWSPDGQRLAFLQVEGYVYIVGADGSNLIQLSGGGMVTEAPVWSPDGSLVAFGRSSEHISDIVVSSPDGSDQRAIAGLKGISLWTSDGSDVRFSPIPDSMESRDETSAPETDRSDQIAVGRQDFPSHSESSQEFERVTASNDLAVRDPAKQAVRDPSERRVTTNLVASSIAWSPDGSEIRFVGAPESMQSDDGAPAYAGIFSIGIDGTDMRIIAEIEWPSLVSWSPDGSRVAVRIAPTPFSSDDKIVVPEVVLYTMSSDGSDRQVLVSRIPGRFVAEQDWRDPTDDIVACSEGYVVPDPQDNLGLVQDCETLLRARGVLAGHGFFLNWISEVPITEWAGVSFVDFSNAYSNESNGQSDRDVDSPLRVRGLFGLRGTLSPALGGLTELEWLQISAHGGLTGSIPPELGNLTKVTHLIINGGLTGSIPPELGNLSSLKRLDLSDNDLTGSIPPELGNLSNLEGLDLRFNHRLTGRIPLEVWNLWRTGALQEVAVGGTSLRPAVGECEGRNVWRFSPCLRSID